MVTGFYVLILFGGIHVLAIHRVPLRMALYMLALLSVAVLSGLVFSRTTFCAHICPVGHLLGLYARMAPMGWRVADPSLCDTCEDRSCVANKNAYHFVGRSCGVGLRPASIQDNSACLLCGQCLKACDRNNPGVQGRPNPGWFRRRWFADILALVPLTAAQAGFALVVSGFVIYEVLTEWGTTEDILLWLPSRMEASLGIEGGTAHGLFTSVTLFILLPLIIWSLPLAGHRLLGGQVALRDYALRFGLAFVPIMAAAHVTKATLKMSSRLPYWDRVFSDPLGIVTATGIRDASIQLAALPAWREPLVTVVALLAMAVGVTLSALVVRRLARKLQPDGGWRNAPLYLIPGVYGGIFSAMFLAWRLF